jgi:hypoxanthine phosphoribosyltransferase
MNETNRIRVHDLVFEKSIDFKQIDDAIGRIAKRLNAELHDRNPLFLSVLNGAFMFSADLFKKLSFPCEISFVKLASYSGTTSTETVRHLIGFDEDIKGRTVVVVEDIIDSGLTMVEIIKQLNEKEAGEIRIATLLMKPEAFKGKYKVDYVGIEIPNDFIVGYGLDYDKHGRNFKDIYKIVE